MEVLEKRTLQERNNLLADIKPSRTGFTPRRIEKLTKQSPPKTMINIDCNHFLRTSREDSATGYRSKEYQLWLEAGKHKPPYPELQDENYNANVWRNFKGNFSFHLSSKGRSVGESAAAAYPITIPKPSKVGDYTFGRFIKETPSLIKDDKLRAITINRTTIDSKTMEQLKIRSYARYPPIDQEGNIRPPEHYKRHPHYFKPIENLPTTEYLVEQKKNAAPTPYGYHESPIKYTPKKSPAWRLNLKSSNSNYQKALKEIRKHSASGSRDPSASNRVKTCTPATSTAPSEVL
ncbi:testis-expressed protein 52-like [Watersipora subatra]|uniref:testis-expressed protein 52-like n=1 Tax=Watersipora subatra TaxID=2589382 RepID=UPI00355BBB94